MNTEYQFQLTKPIKYHAKGDEVEGTFITLAPPSYKQMDKCVPIKQAFYRAAFSIDDGSGKVKEKANTTFDDKTNTSPDDETNTSKNDEDMTPEGLVALLYQSDEDMVKILLYGVELFKSPGIAMLEGSVQVNQLIIQKMSQDDLENMLGRYMVNFILASALSKAGSK